MASSGGGAPTLVLIPNYAVAISSSKAVDWRQRAVSPESQAPAAGAGTLTLGDAFDREVLRHTYLSNGRGHAGPDK